MTIESLCIPGQTFVRRRTGHPRKIYRSSMSTLTQIWTSLMFANISPMTHVSDMNLDKAQLLYCIFQGITMDVAELILDEIHKSVISQIIAKGTAKPLGFPCLISESCKKYKV